MPVQVSYPGVYIQELASGVRTITGVATSITAFVGRAQRGPVNDPVRIQSFADYQRTFGGLWSDSKMSFAVSQFFQNGGSDALIVRLVPSDAAAAEITLPTDTSNLVLAAASPGAWGDALIAIVDHDTADSSDTDLFNLTVLLFDAAGADPTADTPIVTESFRNLTVDSITATLDDQSDLVRVDTLSPDRPQLTGASGVPAGTPGSEGSALINVDVRGDQLAKTGIYALEDADLFNMLCIPPISDAEEINNTTWQEAARYCQERRAMLIVDPPPDWSDTADAEGAVETVRSTITNAYAINAAMFFPRLRMADALQDGKTATFVPCGVIAGIMSRTDAQRGVWKAAAGIDAGLAGVRALTYKLTDGENGRLNPLGLNCLRTLRTFGTVVWGARTLAGDDRLASEWKYVPVRRLALFIEESLFRGTQWVVFEPNDEPLWAQIRLNVGSFMQQLFRQGAFQGSKPSEAFFVKCDRETTTQADIDRGIVNILVGFAPLKPAEFVIIQIQQIANQGEL